MDNIERGILLKNRRIELGLTLVEVGKACGVNKSSVFRWENGENGSLKTSHMEILSKLYRLPIERILGWEDKVIEEPSDIILKRNAISGLIDTITNKEDLENIEKYIKLMVLNNK